MKRLITILISICLIMTLSACAKDKEDQESGNMKDSLTEKPAQSDDSKEAQTEEKEEPSRQPAKLLYMGQGSIRIQTAEDKVIYIDPYVGEGYDKAADLILITHSHYDHNNPDKITNRNADCRVITWKEALKDGSHQTFDLGFVSVEAVEAGYNQNHDVSQCVGYILTLSDGVSVYVTGDTSKTEQMPLLAEKHIDYAFYCCDGVYNMDLEEAAECAEIVGAKHNIPYHVVAEDGVYYDRARAEKFNAPNLMIVDEGEEIELISE